ncbi:hypothetical protein L2E82_10968 [Cichorium intybus]|uniref:Uncharacterized protein n=1 Tax=Cichorium intybus TaxID=13427 RepID=A0ACB9GE10_CICIN|nr:hypothetical protein L2E82_10968 [Cichorium intybus]
MKLEFISKVVFGDGVDNFEKCFPVIKNLTSTLYSDEENDFEVLLHLEILALVGSGSRRRESTQPKFVRESNLGKKLIRFPAALKQLSISGCRLPWSDMTIIQSLPNLEGLILINNGFEGTLWETGEKKFQQLKFLGLYDLNIKQWKASSHNFPCLEQLEVVKCVDLEEIPLELGDFSTLECIRVWACDVSLRISLLKIRQQQDVVGNCELKIIVDGEEMSSFVPNHDD